MSRSTFVVLSFLMSSAISPCLLSSQAFAQAGGVTVNRNYQSYSYGLGSDELTLSRLPQIIKELEIVDEQKAKLEQLNKEILAEQQEEYKKLRGLGPWTRENQQEYREKYEQLRERLAKRKSEVIADVLLPHQIARLNQLQLRFKLRSQGSYALRDKTLAAALELTEEQSKGLQSEQLEMTKKLQEEYAKLREKYRDELLKKVLNKEQLEKLDELLGDEYEIKQPDYSAIYQYRRQQAEGASKKD